MAILRLCRDYQSEYFVPSSAVPVDLRINIEHVLPAPARAIRIVLHRSQAPVLCIGQGIDRYLPKKSNLPGLGARSASRLSPAYRGPAGYPSVPAATLIRFLSEASL